MEGRPYGLTENHFAASPGVLTKGAGAGGGFSIETTMQLLTNSRMTTSKTCLRKSFLRYELGLVPDRDQAPLRIGSALHHGLDLRAKGASIEEAILKATMGYLLVPHW